MTKEEKRREYSRQWYLKNKEKSAAKARAYYIANKERINATVKKYRNENSEKVKARLRKYTEKNKKKIAANAKIYREKNGEKIREKQRLYYAENRKKEAIRKKKYHAATRERRNKTERDRLNSDPIYKLKRGVRHNICGSFKRQGFTKKSKSFKILCCDYSTFLKHIESKFTEGMTLENYGEWHLDHQIPLALAETEEEVIELCHYTNYQPLWKEENFSKGDAIFLENISFANQTRFAKFLSRV